MTKTKKLHLYLKNKKNTRRFRKGSGKGKTKETVKCCMCEKKKDVKNTLIPRICLEKYGRRAHRICGDCWWDETVGFARENSHHGCPGCAKETPLTHVKKEKMVVIDLTDD